jgi:hypothetical protein
MRYRHLGLSIGQFVDQRKHQSAPADHDGETGCGTQYGPQRSAAAPAKNGLRGISPDPERSSRRLHDLAALDLPHQLLELVGRLGAEIGVVHSAKLVRDRKQRVITQPDNIVSLHLVVVMLLLVVRQ